MDERRWPEVDRRAPLWAYRASRRPSHAGARPSVFWNGRNICYLCLGRSRHSMGTPGKSWRNLWSRAGICSVRSAARVSGDQGPFCRQDGSRRSDLDNLVAAEPNLVFLTLSCSTVKDCVVGGSSRVKSAPFATLWTTHDGGESWTRQPSNFAGAARLATLPVRGLCDHRQLITFCKGQGT